MANSDTETSEAALTTALAAARADDAPSPDLLARVEADALRLQPVPAVATPKTRSLGAILRAFGGWPVAAGLAVASAAGLAIGLSAPTLVPGLGSGDSGYEISDLVPGYGLGDLDG